LVSFALDCLTLAISMIYVSFMGETNTTLYPAFPCRVPTEVPTVGMDIGGPMESLLFHFSLCEGMRFGEGHASVSLHG
jgi:hypothetical protein